MSDQEPRLMLVPIKELMANGCSSPRAEAAELLRRAAALVKSDSRDDSATWRAVDALVILKQLNPDHELPGIDEPTGRGGQLVMRGDRVA